MKIPKWIDSVNFDEKGLIPAIAQDARDGTILMVAYMNRESLLHTWTTRRATYWSRSRKKLWKKRRRVRKYSKGAIFDPGLRPGLPFAPDRTGGKGGVSYRTAFLLFSPRQ